MEIKKIAMETTEGKRNVKVANAVRIQMFEKIIEVLKAEGFEVIKAANGDIAITTCIDEASEQVFYTRLSVSLSDKGLDSKITKKAKTKEKVEVAIPSLFEDEDEEDAE